jgi:hypothetical protein
MTDKVAFMVPCAEYTALMPLFYYTKQVLLEMGWDVFALDYGHSDVIVRKDLVLGNKFLENFEEAAQVVLADSKYARVALISKSLSTRCVIESLSKTESPLSKLADVRAVWLTPLWKDETFGELILKCPRPGLHIIGTKDKSYSETLEQGIKGMPNTTVVSIDGADQRLDVEGSISKSLEAIEQTVESIRKFVT